MGFMGNSRLCLDTDVLIRYLKGREPVASAVERAVKKYASCVTAITVYSFGDRENPAPASDRHGK